MTAGTCCFHDLAVSSGAVINQVTPNSDTISTGRQISSENFNIVIFFFFFFWEEFLGCFLLVVLCFAFLLCSGFLYYEVNEMTEIVLYVI